MRLSPDLHLPRRCYWEDYEELKETVQSGRVNKTRLIRKSIDIQTTQPTTSYDETSDTLYMSFVPGVKATGIELNEHILLRIDKEKRKAIGFTFLNYSILIQKADFGPRSFPLIGLTKLPDETREIVMEILESAPVKDVLSLSTYMPSFSQAIPITLLHLPQPA